MATLTYRNGKASIQVRGTDGKRRPIRLGDCTKAQALETRRHVRVLEIAKKTGGDVKPSTVEWVAGLTPVMRRRVEKTGLIGARERRETPALGEWLDRYIAKRTDTKPNTQFVYKQIQAKMVDFFGAGKRLDEITPGDADDFRIYLSNKGLSEGWIRRLCKLAKQFMKAAIKRKLITENPFADLKCGNWSDPSKFHFVTREEAAAVLGACPDPEWRLIFALCRFGGLRCPSEVLNLTWADVDWAKMQFTVHSPKTERHDGKGIRQVPIFPELYPHLQEAFDKAEPYDRDRPETAFVITRYRDIRQNLRTQLERIIRRADLEPWPKLFQNCRSTRETELAETFPIHVVCAWIGNTQSVAAKHYLQVTEAHFEKAVQKMVQNSAEVGRNEPPTDPGEEKEIPVYGSIPGISDYSESVDLQSIAPERS